MLDAIPTIALILAIAATVLAIIFIVPERKGILSNPWGRLAHNVVNFKFLLIEKIMQALYIFCTAYIFLSGFLMLFTVVDTWGGSQWMGGQGLLTMILGPIVVRIVYEFIMMTILLVKHVGQINSKLSNSNTKSAFDNNWND